MTTKISPFIAEQFPAVYREDGEFFIEFAKAYYRWLEDTGNPLYHSRRLPDYFDIDGTPEDFLVHFRDKYLPDFALLTETDKRTLVKHAVDIYRSKGSIRSLKLLFKLVYNDEIQVHLPGDDIFRPSDSKFKIPRYLEVKAAERTSSFIGKEIRGQVSGARAIVESVSRRTVSGTVVDVLQITNVRGNFLYDEIVTTNDGLISGAPRVVGSLTSLILTSGGRNFYEGEIVDVFSDAVGFNGKAKIRTVITQSGQVQYDLVYGGAGFSNTADVYVSERVIEISNKRGELNIPFRDTENDFVELEGIEQPLVTINMAGATGIFPIGRYVVGSNTTANLISFGVVANTTQNTTSYATANVVISDRKVAVIGIDTITSPSPTTLSFNVPGIVYQRKYSFAENYSNTAVGRVFGANSTTIFVDTTYGQFESGLTLYDANHPTTSNTASVTINQQRFTNGTISQYNLLLEENGLSVADETSTIGTAAQSRTATAQYIASNTTHIGIINISPTASFINTTYAPIRSLTSNVYANVVSISSGNPGSFDILSITDTETLYLNTDKLYVNNATHDLFYTVAINATAYGFANDPAANLNSLLIDALTYSQKSIGSIATIGDVDPGSYNTTSPFVLVREPTTAPFERGDYKLQMTDRNAFPFIEGEAVTTTYNAPITTIQFTTLSGNTGFDTSSVGETVYQVRSDGTWAYGTVASQNTTSSPKLLTLTNVYVATSQYGPRTAGNFDTSNDIVGVVSTAHANLISNVANSTILTSLLGKMRGVDGQYATIERTRFGKQNDVSTITGVFSGATGNVVSYQDVFGSPTFGMTANVTTLAGTGTGVATSVEVIDSGFAYSPNETVTLRAANNPYTATATAVILNHGVGQGYWDTTDSFISHEKKIQDSDYFQELSYEIRSSVSRAVYEQKVFDIAHVAGTKMFGAVYSSQVADTIIDAATTNASYTLAVSNVQQYSVGDTVRDATSNTYAVVVSKKSKSSGTFNGYSNVINGGVGVFNSNTAVTKGYNSSFNANLSVNEGKSIAFNASADVIQSVDFTVNGVANVSNVVSASFNASANVLPGISINDFGTVSIMPGNSVTFDANVVITSLDSSFNANSSVANSTTIVFNANTDVKEGRLSFNANTSINPAYSVNIRVDSSTTATTYYDVIDHYDPVFIRNESYWEPSFGYSTVYTGEYDAVQRTRTIPRQGYKTVGYTRELTGRTWGITGTETVWVSSGKSGGYYETRNTYGWIETYENRPIYESYVYYEYEQYIEPVARTTQVKNYRLRPVYNYVPVYRTESYTSPNPEYTNEFSITNANSYFSVGDEVRYHVNPDFSQSGGALSTLVDGRKYVVRTANSSSITLRDQTIVGTGNTLPISYQKIFNYGAIYHKLTLISGQSITGANSFIQLTNANSYFSTNDVITYSTSPYGNSLINHSGLSIQGIANNSNLYVQFVNSTGLAISTTAGGSRLALTRGATQTDTLTGYNRDAGVIATASASLFSNGDTVIYRVQSGNNSLVQLQHQKSYYIQFANTTHIALSRTADGVRIPLTKGLTETGHLLVSTKAGNGVISISSANTKYKVNDSVRYYVDSGNTPLTGLVNNQTYYIQLANATHIAVANTRGGPRVELNQGLTESGHHFVGTGEIYVDNPFRIGDFVQYVVPSGQTAISNLASNAVYRVGFTDNHTIRLTNTNSIGTITINAGGSGYTNDDIITIASGNPVVPAIFQLQTNTTGGITGYSMIHSGLGYETTPTIPTLNISAGVSAQGANLTASLTGSANIQFALQANSASHKLVVVNPNTNIIALSGGSRLLPNSAVEYYTSNNVAPMAGLTNGSVYYVDYASGMGVSFKSTTTGARIELTPGSDTSGHNIILVGSNNTIRTNFAASVSVGDLVQYDVSPTNTPIAPLENRNIYYVAFANSTHMALSTRSGGPRVTLTRGKFESGHYFYKVSGNSAIVATSYAANLSAGDVVRYVDQTGTNPIYPLISNNEYYVQFANTTHIALANTEHEPRLWLQTGSADTGHRFIGQRQKSTILTSAANSFVIGDIVKYITAAGNTPLTGFTNGTNYYIQFANDTHVALSLTRAGDRVNLFKGSVESGHYFSPTNTQKATIRALNGFVVGDTVQYAFTSSNTGLRGVSNNTTYYVESANGTHFALTTFSGGPRVDLLKGQSEAGHSIFTVGLKGSINVGSAGVDFTAGDQVKYFTNTGTNLPGIINGGVYYIQFANATHIALSPTVGGYRIPIDKGLTETGHKIVKTGPHSLMVTPFAANLSVGEPVTYTSGTPLAIRPSGYLVSGTTYYVEFSNATHVALATEPGGERLTLVQQTSPGSNHTLTDAVINSITVSVTTQLSNATFTVGSSVENVNTASSQTIANVSVSM